MARIITPYEKSNTTTVVPKRIGINRNLPNNYLEIKKNVCCKFDKLCNQGQQIRYNSAYQNSLSKNNNLKSKGLSKILFSLFLKHMKNQVFCHINEGRFKDS